MPYNNAPISPHEEITGSSVLPLARVKKIINQDEDIKQCSNSAAFVVSVATEMFIRQLTEQAHNVVKSERKPRRNIQYRDFATAVARIDRLEFLADVIPQTTTYKQFKETRAREAAKVSAVEAGQMTLDGKPARRTGDEGDEDATADHELNGINGANGYPSLDIPNSPVPKHQQALSSLNGSPIVDRTVQPILHAHPPPEDIDMTG